MILDVNMDEAMLDGVEAMTRFLRRLATEPDVAKVPVMVDSSRWGVIEAGLQQLQGRGVVNSISLKEGEEEFLRQARLCRRYGASVVVMAFDEQGQADTVERRVAVLTRAHRLLTERGRASRPRTSSSTPTSSRSRPAWRSTRTTRTRSSRRPGGSRRRSPTRG